MTRFKCPFSWGCTKLRASGIWDT